MTAGATPVALISVLSVLNPLSGGGLAVGVSYLNLERFRYRKKIRDYARYQLKTISPEQEQPKPIGNGDAPDKKAKVELPPWLMGMDICKELHRIAALPDHDGADDDPEESDKSAPFDKSIALQGSWSSTYASLFEHHLDRRIVMALTFFAGTVLVIGAANSVNMWTAFIPLFAASPTGSPNMVTVLTTYVLMASLVLPMIFVVVGRRVVVWGRERVRRLVHDCKIALQQLAQGAVLNAATPPAAPAPLGPPGPSGVGAAG